MTNELDQKLLDALDRLARGQRVFRQEIATRHGLTPLQAQILSTVTAGPPPAARTTALARELDVTQPTVTDAILSLERKHLVRRHADPADGRRSVVRPTSKGRALARRLAHAERPLLDALAGLPPDSRSAGLETLLGLIASMHRAGIITVARTCMTCQFHEGDTGSHYCALLDIPLETEDLRVNCPEHKPA